MFGILKKKITGFIDKLIKKEESKPDSADVKEVNEAQAELRIIREEPKPESGVAKEKPKEIKKEATKPVPEKKHISEPEKPKQKIPERKEKPAEKKEPEKKIVSEEKKIVEKKQEYKLQVEKEKETVKHEEKIIIKEKEVAEKPAEAKLHVAETKKPEEEKPKERIKLSPFSAIKSFVTQEVEISENEVKEMLDNLELELLEGDVDMEVAEHIKNELNAKLVGRKIRKNQLQEHIKDAIRETLIDILSNEKQFEFIEKIKNSEKPLKVMFLGTNGSGKTTTIAKMAQLAKNNKYTVVFAAADTFRAAAIEQMAVHAERLGVKLVKRDYGSDPTSVAYDAVNYAKAHGTDVVMIDTAGRQDTNVNLINELKKMNRVIKPDLKIYVGESIAGNAILEQVRTFHNEIGIDGVILTKLDCDPKGGTMLSISKSTGVPIVYIGTGQGYEDLEVFDPKEMAERIVE